MSTLQSFELPHRSVIKGYRLKLYPNAAQGQIFARNAGCCRWLWNHLLAAQKDRYECEKKFIFRMEMQKMLPSLKREFPWLAEAPSHSLQRVCANLDKALKNSFRKNAGFPKFKSKIAARDSFYVPNDRVRVEGNKLCLPKTDPVRFRCGRLPEGKIMGATVSFDGDSWWCAIQCEVQISDEKRGSAPDTTTGIDLGVRDRATASDGTRFPVPKYLRKAQNRLRRAQRTVARRQKRSANRAKAVANVRRIHRKIAERRKLHAHIASKSLVDRSSVIVMETLNVQGMMANRRVAMSFADAGCYQLLSFVRYKSDWAGVTFIQVDRFEPSTQTCSACGHRKTGSEKLRLDERIFECSECGHVMDRDWNAAMNLRRIGLEKLGLLGPNEIHVNDVGQALPEREGSPSDACGDPSAGPAALAAGRYASTKQEPSILGDG